MAFNLSQIPMAILADSYKATHFIQYPEANKMVAYGEFRAPFAGQKEDYRLVFYGIRYIVENYINRKWTMEEVRNAEKFYSTHNAGYEHFPWPKDLFEKIVTEHNGYLPLKIEALPEGSVVHIHTPVYQITAEKEYSRLVTFLETILTQVWYPSTVATLSRRAKDAIAEGFKKSVDDDKQFLLDSRLQDFGFRGCTCVEQSILGGSAHLLNFTGSDTMSASYYVQFVLNGGRPVGNSVPATEHSVMTSWHSEAEAIRNMIDNFGTGIYSIVMDSYDYTNALDTVVPSVAEEKKKKGGLLVYRPDSGNPVEVVLQGLRAAEKTFGATVNSKGYKVLNGAAVLQGDGINIVTLGEILNAALEAQYSAQNLVFGMGGGLLQKVNRDTMSFATKLSFIEYKNGEKRDVMKYPKTDAGKISLPGELRVERGEDGLARVYPKVEGETAKNELKVVYDHGPVADAFPESFDDLRKRVTEEWERAPKAFDPISPPLKAKIAAWIEQHKSKFEVSSK
eukprot:TRINITY_DN16331_c0_g1_i1.p1 TRINITY_DN16331_c0_g1~~TRINITY_DN16331_c0_g1_i1.p1  ORF type:complete len:508 (+),score=108.24 TRINITY_DN16331_c0_g1_i1:87-1610(+)